MEERAVVTPISTKSCSSLRWQKIFGGLLQILQSQHTQIEFLTKERKILADRINLQHSRWVSDVHLYQDRLSQMERERLEAEMGTKLEAQKFDLLLGMKQKEALLYKEKLEFAESDLGDLQLRVDYLALQHSLQMEKSGEKSGADKGGVEDAYLKDVETIENVELSSKILQREVRRLKAAFEKISSRKNSEVSALLAERNFVWDQFKRMESDYVRLVNCKNDELEKLRSTMEKLQLMTDEKDSTISKLKENSIKLEVEVERLTKQLKILKGRELIRTTRNGSGTPARSHTRTELHKCSSGKENINGERKREWLGELRASDQAKDIEKVGRGSRKRGNESISGSKSATPRLFTSTFRVPKLKKASPIDA